MPARRLSIGFTTTLALFAITLFATGTYSAAQQSVLYSFGSNGSTDALYPFAGLTFDNAGNLYGATAEGGAHGGGAVFELTPKAGGGWKEKVLHSFGSGKDGQYPYASLVFDGAGNLYGTTYQGGAATYGTVFELSPKAGGGWKEKVLHSFLSGKDGQYPYAALIFDSAGNLYGTTYQGGTPTGGTVFELSPKAGGGWTEKVLHSFGAGEDGQNPYAGLISDSAGKLYGTTVNGGASGLGTVFELAPKGDGKWTEKVVHNFKNAAEDGSNPHAGLILDTSGNLYGATQSTIFELKSNAGGGWTEKVLADVGAFSNLIFDAAGDLLGTTTQGGTGNFGTIFELTLKADGKWTDTILFDFMGGADGYYPYAGLILDSKGNLYGTTYEGGSSNAGTAFEFTP